MTLLQLSYMIYLKLHAISITSNALNAVLESCFVDVLKKHGVKPWKLQRLAHELKVRLI